MFSWLFERENDGRYCVSRRPSKDVLWTYFGHYENLTLALDAVEEYDTPPW